LTEEHINRQVIKGFAWEGSTKLAVQIISWIATIFVARILDPSDYGVVAIAAVFVELLTLLTRIGLTEALINRSTVTQEDYDSTFWLSLLIGLTVYGILYLLAPLCAYVYRLPVLTDIMRLAGLVLVLTSLNVVPIAIAMRNLDFRYRALVEMSANFIMSITVVSLAVAGFGPWSLVWGIIARNAAEVLAYAPLLRRIPPLRIRIKETRPIISYAVHLIGAFVLEYFTLRADVLIIGFFLGQKIVGYYSIAIQISTIPMDKLGSIFNRVAFPAISRTKQDTVASRTLFLQMHRYLLALAYPILIGIALVADDAVMFLLTEKWQPIVPLLQALCVVNLLRVSGMLIPHVLQALAKVKLVLAFHALSIVVLSVAFLVGVHWGINGVAAAWIVAYPILYCILLAMLSRQLHLGMSTLVDSVRPVLVASLVMLAVLLAIEVVMLDSAEYIRLLMGIVCGATAYLGTFVVLYRKDLQELKAGLALLRAS
jgi:O-antigen/teichoic acid export membrane protein